MVNKNVAQSVFDSAADHAVSYVKRGKNRRVSNSVEGDYELLHTMRLRGLASGLSNIDPREVLDFAFFRLEQSRSKENRAIVRALRPLLFSNEK